MSAVIEHKVVRCCVTCDECQDCYTYNLYQLRELMNAIHISIADFGKSFVQKINYGYASFSLTPKEVDKLMSLKETIRNYYDSLRTKTMGCLCDYEFQKVKEQVGRIINLGLCKQSKETDIRYDYSQYDEWVAQNPYCVSYDAWTKGLVACQSPSFLISSTKEERVTRMLYAISRKDTTGCVVKLLAFANKARCENKLVASSKSQAKCKIELTALSKAHKCDISLELYSKLISCNLSFSVISTVLGCGGRFALDAAGNPIVKVGVKSSKIDDIIKLAGGTYQNMNEEEFNAIYG